MNALKHNGLYPFFNPKYRWVFVDGRRSFNLTYIDPADSYIDPADSYIAVDVDIAEYIKEHDIILEWSRVTKNTQTANIKSVCGKSTIDIIKSGNTYQTLAEIITGTKGKTRGPQNSFHANDWTRSAFDRNVTEPKYELTSDEILEQVLSHNEDRKPNLLFDLPTRALLSGSTTYPPEMVSIPTIQHHGPDNKTLEQVPMEFEQKMVELFPPEPYKTNYTLPIGITLLTLLVITFIWIV